MTDDPHTEPLAVTAADGLHLPDAYVGHDGGLVVRVPSGTTMDFKPREWGGFVPTVQPRHFGAVDAESPNSHLAADEVSLKKYGADAETFAVVVE